MGGAVPAIGGYLGHGVGPGDNVGPVPGEVVGTGIAAGHTHDRNVERCLIRLVRGRIAQLLPPPFEQLCGAFGHLGVEGGDRGGRGAGGGDLAEHVEAFATLFVLVHRDEPARCAAQALAGDPQPPEVEFLQLLPDLTRARAVLPQPLRGGGEDVGIRRGGAAGGMARGGTQQCGGGAVDGRALEAGQYGSGGHGLLGEQIGGAHQDTGTRPALGQGTRGCHRHRRGSLVVDATGEEHVEFVGVRAGEQPLDLLLPEREGGARADVPAALEPLEDEAPRSFGEKLLQESRRRHMQIGSGPGGFEGAAWAGRPPAMIAYGGPASETAASCSRRSSSGAKPSSPTPQSRPARRSAVRVSSSRTSGPSMTARARKGSPPASATAEAKAGRSLTRVMGPWATGRWPSPGRERSGRARTAASRWPVMAARTAWTTEPVVR